MTSRSINFRSMAMTILDLGFYDVLDSGWYWAKFWPSTRHHNTKQLSCSMTKPMQWPVCPTKIVQRRQDSYDNSVLIFVHYFRQTTNAKQLTWRDNWLASFTVQSKWHNGKKNRTNKYTCFRSGMKGTVNNLSLSWIDWPSEVVFANSMATFLPNLEWISQIVKELFKIKWKVVGCGTQYM